MNRISGSTVEATGSAENKVIVKEYEEIIDAAIGQLPPGKRNCTVIFSSMPMKTD